MKLFDRITEMYHKFLRTFFKDVPKSLYIVFLCLFTIYSITPIFFYPNMDFYRIYYINSKILLWAVAIVTIIYIPLKLRINYFYKTVKTIPLKKKHLAIIIVKYDIFFKSMFYMLINTEIFLRRIRKENIPYTVYVVKDKDEFLSVITNKNVKAVFVFGHGQKHGLKFGNELWHYCNIPKMPHIRFVIQFHCNHYTGKSLHEHLGCSGNLVAEDVTIYQDINKFIDSEHYLPQLRDLLKINTSNITKRKTR
jgi:hypothetical protein